MIVVKITDFTKHEGDYQNFPIYIIEVDYTPQLYFLTSSYWQSHPLLATKKKRKERLFYVMLRGQNKT